MRVENLFLDDKGDIQTVCMFDIDVPDAPIINHTLDIISIYPVPLTETILGKLDPSNNGKAWNIEGQFDIVRDNSGFMCMHDSGVELRHVDYVHEIQNFFFGLYGGELDIRALVP